MTALLGNLFVLGGLVWCACSAVQLMRTDGPRVSARNGYSPSSRAALVAVFGPQLPIWLGFLLSGSTRSWWSLAAVLPVAGLTLLALELLRTAHHNRKEQHVASAPTAVVLLTAALVQLGSLLAVRLVVAPDPDDDLRASINIDALGEIVAAVWRPLLLFGGVLLAIGIRSRYPSRKPAAATPTTTSEATPHTTLATTPKRGRWTARVRTVWSDGHWWSKQVLRAAVLVVLGVAPALAGGLRLTVFGIATPEYAKPIYLWFLAVLLAQLAPRFTALSRFRVVPPLHVVWPIVLFLAMAVGSVTRLDAGPLISVLVATLVMLVATTAGVARVRGDEHWGTARGILGATPPFVVPAAAFVAVLYEALHITGYMAERFVVWREPWQFSWNSLCLPAAPPPGLGLPPGTTGCQEALSSYLASRYSQVAQSLAAVADGGLWGRGLGDTITGRIPAGSTDFVLAIMWNKLGGLVVIAATGLVALLAVALVRTGPALRIDRSKVQPAALFSAGLAGLLVSQQLFVLCATLNVLPHSGITAPLLSRGGQSTLAILVAVTAAVALAYRAGPGDPDPDPDADPASDTDIDTDREDGAPAATVRRYAPALVTVAVAVGMTAHAVAVPYSGHAEDLPYCGERRATVDPAVCTTDRFRVSRIPVVLSIGGTPQYRRTGTGAPWEPIGNPTLTADDLAGIVDLGTGPAAVDLDFVQDAVGSRTTGPADRLMPPLLDRRPDAEIDLTLDPTIQHAVADALRTPGGSPALAGGSVVLDSRTGAILAAAGAPLVPLENQAPADPARDDAIAKFDRAQNFGILGPDGTIDPAGSAGCTKKASPDMAAQCRQWVAHAIGSPADQADLRRYVNGDENVTLPPPVANRGLDARYQPGSTFKVVTTIAYLRMPGASIDHRIDAPLSIDRPGSTPVRNAGGGVCRGTDPADGKIALTQALAVSCNTAFVRLAQEVGWDRMRQAALDLGFSTDPTGPAWMSGPGTGVASFVPATPEDGIANAAIGGGEIVATPLQMAGVLAAAANGGTAVAPRLVEKARSAADGQEREMTTTSRPVMTHDQADLVLKALSRTTVDGTAKNLHVPRGHDIWIKTGTHEIYPVGKLPEHRFVREYAWVIGAIATNSGPVAFATAVETRDEAEGNRRVFEITEKLLTSVVEART